MSKLKLNIQYFGSTNKTTHYDLSQYVASDKPTYLIDYNQDMAKIDAGIYDAISKATVNESNIGTMQDLTTTVKSSLVSAINEINIQLGTNTTNIGINASNIATLGTNQGDLVNLMTTAKNNLVSAINELKGVNDTQNTNIQEVQIEIEKFNLVNFKNYSQASSSDIVTTNIQSISKNDIIIATNSDGSLFKIYGEIRFTSGIGDVKITYKNTGINPTSAFDISLIGIQYVNNVDMYAISCEIASNGDLTLNFGGKDANYSVKSFLSPCLYFAKNFGDTPEV